MIFKPEKTKLWDTFVLYHEGQFYLYYLQFINQAWDSYALATSPDGVHWTDRGTILEPGPGTGTGMVFRADDCWILTYCFNLPHINQIKFARSTDLLRWEPLPADFDLYPDARWYDTESDNSGTNARWGDMWVDKTADGTYLGFITATDKSGPPSVNGAPGLAESKDGMHWTALPPASTAFGMSWAEIAGHFELNGRHYVLASSSSGLGPRFDPVYNPTGKAGGTYVMVSDDIRGPYRLIDGDPMLLGCRNAPGNWAYLPTYYLRACHADGELLAFHQWMERADFINAWLSTAKVMRESEPGRIGLYYWKGNEKLKGEKIFALADAAADALHVPKPQAAETGAWTLEGGTLRGETVGTSLAWFPTGSDCFVNGAVIEAEIKFDAMAAGIFMGNDRHSDGKPFEGFACLLNKRGFAEFGKVTFGVCTPPFMAENNSAADFTPGKWHALRILVRGEFVEMYLDDRLVHCYGFTGRAVRDIGLFAEQGKMEVRKLEVWPFA